VYERCTRLEVPIRQPYAGELVFTAFSGSHQDAINNGMAAQEPARGALWQVPYLPIDPKDIGRSYEAIIRINSQSGKGGVAYVMESEFGFQLPRELRVDFGKRINALADARGDEISNAEIFAAFAAEYLNCASPIALKSFRAMSVVDEGGEVVECSASITIDGVVGELRGRGNGPINAFVRALDLLDIPRCRVLSYAEHSLSQGSGAEAVAYIQIQLPNGRTLFGAATDTNIELASIKAVISAINRALAR
jgi:2-isopropylmalate synthase